MIIFVFLFGLCVGSFVFCFYERFCERKLILQAHSFCFKCEKRLKFYHLIPFVSFIFLRGRCGFCGAKISPLSFVCELLCGLLFVFAFLITLNAEFNALSGEFNALNDSNINVAFGGILNALNSDFIENLSLIDAQKFMLNFIFLALFLSTVLLLSLIDLKLKAVPETLLWAAFILAFCYSVNLNDIYGFWGEIDGFLLNAPLFAGFFFLLKSLVSCVLNLKRQNENLESMGEGDILIIASMGGILGFTKGFYLIFLAAILALPLCIYFKLLAKKKTKRAEFLSQGAEFKSKHCEFSATNSSTKKEIQAHKGLKIATQAHSYELPFIPFLSLAFVLVLALGEFL